MKDWQKLIGAIIIALAIVGASLHPFFFRSHAAVFPLCSISKTVYYVQSHIGLSKTPICS